MKKLLPNKSLNKPQIILTNLIDVILLIVFFFMITSSFSKHQKKMPVNLPSASTGVNIESDTLAFQILNNGKIYHNKNETSIQEAIKITQNYLGNNTFKPIIIEADKDVYYGKVVELLDNLKSCGATNLGLTVTNLQQQTNQPLRKFNQKYKKN